MRLPTRLIAGVVVGSTLLCAGARAAPATGQTPGNQTVQGSGTVTLSPGQSVTFTFPQPALPPGMRQPTREFPVSAKNQSDQTATVTLQGNLTIEVPPMFAVQMLPPQTACHYGVLAPPLAPPPDTGPANVANCAAGLGFSGDYTFTAAPHSTGAPGTTTPQLSAGWNLVSDLLKLSACTGPLYGFQAGDTAYRQVDISPTVETPNPALSDGAGYWCWHDESFPGEIRLALSGPQTVTVTIPAGQYVLIGNSGNTEAAVTGVDAVYTYDPASGEYQAATTLQAGQGAWAYSASGGAVTIAGQ